MLTALEVSSRSKRQAHFMLGIALAIAALAKMSAACGPGTGVADDPVWQHMVALVDNVPLDSFLVTPLASEGADGLWFGYKNLIGDGGVVHLTPDVADGKRWEIHPAGPDGKGPASGFIFALLPDGEGGVWAGMVHGGVSHYDATAEIWRTAAEISKDVLAILMDQKGVWLATFGGGIAQKEFGSHGWKRYTRASTAGGLQDDKVVALIKDGANGLWAGTYGGGVSHYSPERDEWRSFTVDSTDAGLGSNVVRALAVDVSGHLWVGTFGGGVSRYDADRGNWDLYTNETTGGALVSDYVLTLLPEANGGLWAGLSNLRDEGGLAFFDGETWRSYTLASSGGGMLSNDVRALAPNGTAGVWIGTGGGGLSYLSSDHNTWATFTKESTGGSLADDTILALLPDADGGTWVGTASGLSHVRWSGP